MQELLEGNKVYEVTLVRGVTLIALLCTPVFTMFGVPRLLPLFISHCVPDLLGVDRGQRSSVGGHSLLAAGLLEESVQSLMLLCWHTLKQSALMLRRVGRRRHRRESLCLSGMCIRRCM